MYMYTQGHSRLISTGVYIPSGRVTSYELMEQIESTSRFGVSCDWLQRVTGIREKRVTPEGILPSDMAVHATREAMDRGGIKPSDIDAIVYTGGTRDYLVEPATAHTIQAKLGALNAVAFDVSNACHGFMNGIHLMDALIATGQVRRGLVVTGEQGSRVASKAIKALRNTDDRAELTLLAAGLTLGDAGAAMIMGPKLGPDTGFMGFMLQSQGQHSGFCTAGGVLTDGPVITDMPTIIGESAKLIAAMFHELMYERLGWNIDDLAKYIIHQVGGKIFKLHHEILNIPLEIMPKTIYTMGNLITANIPVAIHNAVYNQEVSYDNKLYLSAAGSGISIGQAGLIWDAM